MIEEWARVVGYGGRYEVSNLGKVRRVLTRYGNRNFRVLRPAKNRNRYLYVVFFDKKHHYIHSLVASAFIGPCPEGMEVNHKDRNRENNGLDNLEYLTHEQNVQHSYENGRRVLRGEETGKAKLTDVIVREIMASNVGARELGRFYGVDHSQIVRIRQGKNWRHVR